MHQAKSQPSIWKRWHLMMGKGSIVIDAARAQWLGFELILLVAMAVVYQVLWMLYLMIIVPVVFHYQLIKLQLAKKLNV
jgi:hypothetical protein